MVITCLATWLKVSQTLINLTSKEKNLF